MINEVNVLFIYYQIHNCIKNELKCMRRIAFPSFTHTYTPKKEKNLIENGTHYHIKGSLAN